MTSWTERDRIRFEPRAKKFGGAVVSLRHGSPAVILRLDRRIHYSRALAAEHKRSGILDHPLEPVIGLAEGETRWRVMTVEDVG